MKTTLHMLATLIVVGMLSGGALSLVNDWADPLIKENQRKVREAAISFLVPGGTSEQVVDQDGLSAWKVNSPEGELQGWVVRYSGTVVSATVTVRVTFSAALLALSCTA